MSKILKWCLVQSVQIYNLAKLKCMALLSNKMESSKDA